MLQTLMAQNGEVDSLSLRQPFHCCEQATAADLLGAYRSFLLASSHRLVCTGTRMRHLPPRRLWVSASLDARMLASLAVFEIIASCRFEGQLRTQV